MPIDSPPSYFEKLTAREMVEFFAVVITAGIAFARLPLDLVLVRTGIYIVSFGWLGWWMTRIAARLQLVGSALIPRLLADALMLAVVHFVFAAGGLFQQAWMIFGLVATPAAYLIFGAWWHHRRPEAREGLGEALARYRGDVREMRHLSSRAGCLFRLHDWTPHSSVDHLCICDRCTKIAPHRWRGDQCSRCGAPAPEPGR